MKPAFRDRKAAGERLASMLRGHTGGDTVVLAIPAGGVPVAAAIASRLGLELQALPVSKALYPWTTESGFGAVALDGTEWLGESGLTQKEIDKAVAQARAKVERRTARLRGGKPLPDLAHKTVILVDDGVAAGSTMRTAIAALRKHGAKRIVIAVPTAHKRSVDLLRPLVEDIVCPDIRGGSRFAVADAYEEWRDLTDDEIEAMLK